MPLLKPLTHTAKDYWELPEGQRAELIGGQLYNMAPPSRIHQELVSALHWAIRSHIEKHNGSCKIYPAPFAVNLNADDKTYVEPDISVICDRGKLSDRGCEGAPDWVIEIVSPSSRRMDYSTKNALYSAAGVREYWIIDPDRQRTTVYRYSEDDAPMIYTYDQEIPVGIFPELKLCVADLI
ncbi:MAG: Uma2 family endonuclease [Eubacteriales bacterium]|nr:Uma2 family endonuclease [Eubacteriales bacterium]